MSSPASSASGVRSTNANGGDPNPPTFAEFAPNTLGHYSSASKRRSTVLVHQKSPLLVATPPQITRALAHFYPFLVPLNKLAALLTWTTGDPWESFLLVATFWGTVLYGDVVLRWAGPLVAVVGLTSVLYLRRYSPLSSTEWTGEKVQKGKGREKGEKESSQRKTLDDIVDTLKLFTSRCNILLDPLLQFTDYLSTQRTATSATTRPALTSLFIRILFVTPVWIVLTLPPLYIVTTKRFVLTIGTLILSWHSRPARVSRTILWRSKTLRKITSAITGLNFELSETDTTQSPPLPPRKAKGANEIAASLAAKRGLDSATIRFTFSLYENQRRWLGIGWTSSMLAYERAAWTDEHLNPTPPKDQFELPEVEGGQARWRWVEGSEWQVESGVEGDVGKKDSRRNKSNATGGEWVYYDSKWRNGRRGQDGWGRYTRRRKWVRDAELVEVTQSPEMPEPATPKHAANGGESFHSEATTALPSDPPPDYSASAKDDAETSSASKEKKRGWFRRNSVAGSSQKSRTSSNFDSGDNDRNEDEEFHSPLRHHETNAGWALGDEVRMQLG